ncbi:A24 family peptidase C-terminal domain-containing protein [Salinilacihabitans rarus]|uniref:A24 family peptidase C-terminal domain-containing protein n=1 Tax=Salinilacihabitans rarus TaxID=2961596 RepID=UPI0020C908FE|nr:A24 family peptidase C-terminal domain-containing protein [Salinilacihabitans rarus]
MTLASAPASTPDLLRLLVVPVFAWAALRDVATRRVPSSTWIPLGALGAALLVWDARAAYAAGGFVWGYDFLVPAAVSLGVVAPLAYLFWWVGGFGGADAKALLALALWFPTTPTYAVGPWTLPLSTTPIGAFSLTILTNAVLVGAAVPVALAARNAAAGRFSAAMVVGWPVPVERVPDLHGRLLETPDGRTVRGLDLDALRMYLRWRGLSLADLRADPDRYRDPATLPAEPNPPTDGAVEADGLLPDGGAPAGTDDGAVDDPWGAAAFLDDVDGSAYGTSADRLRAGLEVLCEEDRVWISPGTPFLVPVFGGLLVALVYGDVLVGALP